MKNIKEVLNYFLNSIENNFTIECGQLINTDNEIKDLIIKNKGFYCNDYENFLNQHGLHSIKEYLDKNNIKYDFIVIKRYDINVLDNVLHFYKK